MGSNNYWQTVAGNVRAEMARQRRTATDLIQVLHISRNSVYRRMNGETPFDLAELETVASLLNLPLTVLTSSGSHASLEAVAA